MISETITKQIVSGGLDLEALEQVTLPSVTNKTLGGIVGTVVGQYVLPIAGFITLGVAVAGGFEFMFSYGDQKKVVSAKEKITYGIIGFTVVFASWWLTRLIGRIFSIKVITDIFG